MRKPAKKYFSPEYGAKSIMMMRTWMANGAKPIDIARWIKTEYAKAEDDGDREHLGIMMCATISAERNDQFILELAEKCSQMFRLPHSVWRSHAESALMELTKNPFLPIKWLEDFNPYFIKKCKLPSATAPSKSVTRAFSFGQQKEMVTIDKRYGIYYFRGRDGRAWLMIVNTCPDAILVDEEDFGTEPPMYFTENTHFISPVWMVTRVAKILDYILMRIGYPPVHINRMVVFDSPGVELINEEELIDREAWQDVDIVLPDRTPMDKLVGAITPVLRHDNPKTNENDLDTMLYLSLMATTTILEGFHVFESPDEYTEEQLKDWCKKTCIFTPDNWDFLLDGFDEE